MRNNLFRSRTALFPVVFGFLCLTCTVLEPSGESFTLLFYNVENLFDAVVDGTEYVEFTPAEGWTTKKAEDRLAAIGSVLSGARPAPDVIAMAEVENGELLDELFDRYVVDVPYPYRVFAGHPGAAVGVALASRYPVTSVRTHLPRAEMDTPLRPVLEVHLRLPMTGIVIFVNHWKSKRGGAPETEALRRASARLVTARMAELASLGEDAPIILCGDLNEESREGELVRFAYPTAIMPAGRVREWQDGTENGPSWFETGCTEEFLLIAGSAEDASELATRLNRTVLVDGWAETGEPGSYRYGDRWERIDHIMYTTDTVSGPVLSDPRFSTVVNGKNAGVDGTPMSWREGGVSDHLPVMVQWEMARPD